MSDLLVRGGRIADPEGLLSETEPMDLLILEGRIAAIGKNLAREAPAGAPVLEVPDCVVAPGFIDMHVHLREPGQGQKETIASGTAAAARGGITTVLCMPNTSPPIDNASAVRWVLDKAAAEAKVRVLAAGAITKGGAGEEMAPIGSLKAAGVVAITDDGGCVQNHELMRRAVQYAKMFDLPVLDHCEETTLVGDGVMHEGLYSVMLGLPGWPAEGEELIVARDILLAEKIGHRIHCQHVSSAGSVELIRAARRRGVPISGEACPHHFTLTDAAIAGSEAFWPDDGAELSDLRPAEAPPSWPAYDTNFKMNPPLRSATDREAVLAAAAEGVLTAIASDHAPHTNYDKEVEFDYAPFGVAGLESEVGLALSRLYHSGRCSLRGLVARFTLGPAEILGLRDRGRLRRGFLGDLTILRLDARWVFRAKECVGKGRNTPFDGWRLTGKPVAAVVGGQAVWTDPQFVGGAAARD